MRLIDEILTQSAYLDLSNSDPIEFVAISNETLSVLTEEISYDLNIDDVSLHDIEKMLTLKVLIIPSFLGIDYRFFKEVKH
jgi:hypothetical protein